MRKKPDYATFPFPLLASQITAYIEDRKKPSSPWLTDILTGNLRKCITDYDNFFDEYLRTIVLWLHTEAPATCWTSPGHVVDWLAGKPRQVVPGTPYAIHGHLVQEGTD